MVGAVAIAHDFDGDRDVDLADFGHFADCYGNSSPACLSVQDFDAGGVSNGAIDQDDYTGLEACLWGPGAVPPANGVGHDAEPDGDVDLADYAGFQRCFGSTSAACRAVFDFDARGVSDGVVNRADLDGFELRMRGPNQAGGGGCPRRSGGKDDGLRADPVSGTFALHGRPIDVLPDGKVLLYVRARHYDPANGRWLQRDPRPYNDSFNLYEAFQGNAEVNSDPRGEGVLTWLLTGDYGLSDWDFVLRGGVGQAALGFATGGARASVDAVVGAASGVREMVYVLADGTVIVVDIPLTLAGHPLSYEPLSQIGRLSAQTDETWQLTGRVAGTTAANVVTLGAYNVVEGTIDYAQTGDAEALARNVGGQGLLTLGFVGGAKAVPHLEAVARTTALRAGMEIGRVQFAAETPLVAPRAAMTEFATQRGLSPQAVMLEQNIGKGLFGESDAIAQQIAASETVVRTQFEVGASLRGFESVSVLREPTGLTVYVNEVKAMSGLVAPSKLSALGLNRPATFRTNLGVAQREVVTQLAGDPALQRAVFDALRYRTFTVRIIGQPGVRISAATEIRVQRVTGALSVEVVEMLPP